MVFNFAFKNLLFFFNISYFLSFYFLFYCLNDFFSPIDFNLRTLPFENHLKLKFNFKTQNNESYCEKKYKLGLQGTFLKEIKRFCFDKPVGNKNVLFLINLYLQSLELRFCLKVNNTLSSSF